MLPDLNQNKQHIAVVPLANGIIGCFLPDLMVSPKFSARTSFVVNKKKKSMKKIRWP